MTVVNKMPQLILASSSQRRKQLLEEAGYSFRVVEPSIPEPDETFNKLLPAQQAEALAYFKARAVAEHCTCEWILGADTIIALGIQTIGKPDDIEHARGILTSLSGSRHHVVTGVAILAPDGRRLIASDTTTIKMRVMSPQDIQDYLDSGQWQGKAGAYGIQGQADRYIESVEGSFSNVVGLPMELLGRMLNEILDVKRA